MQDVFKFKIFNFNNFILTVLVVLALYYVDRTHLELIKPIRFLSCLHKGNLDELFLLSQQKTCHLTDHSTNDVFSLKTWKLLKFLLSDKPLQLTVVTHWV